MRTVEPSLPLEPLWEIARVTADLSDEANHMEGFSSARLSEMIGISTRAITRWRTSGGIPWTSADEAAVALGLHPALVWGDDWWNIKGDFDALADDALDSLVRHEVAEVERQALDG